ncbi:MAG: hypothetical protein ABSB41_11445 [Anaerolineales bacterium]
MNGSAKSAFLFGIYVAGLGLMLVFFPNPLLRLVSLSLMHEVWIHLAGMPLIFMGFFSMMTGRETLVPLFRWTLLTRGGAAAFVTVCVLTCLIPCVILLFWLSDLAGAPWSFFALRTEYQLLQG